MKDDVDLLDEQARFESVIKDLMQSMATIENNKDNELEL